MDALLIVIIVAAVTSAACWVLSLITRDTSWVDRAWSIVPVVYVWIFVAGAFVNGEGSARVVVMGVLATAWGARLTFNFARKGGYTGTEDYRWAILRSRMSPALFQVFNLLFIVLYQMTLLVLITLPALIAWQHPTPFGVWDAVFAALFVAFLVGETVADQQQWNFHQAKRRGEAQGFLTTGMFAYSRHPNFFFEQAQWWALFLFGAIAAGSLLQWTVLGAVLLTILFIGSTRFTEEITLSKYPEYADYQATTSPIVPWPPRRKESAVTA